MSLLFVKPSMKRDQKKQASSKRKSAPFKVELRPGTKLSSHFNNSAACYKVVELDNLLGYVVGSAICRVGVAVIYPLYYATIHVKVGDTLRMMSFYEQGDRLNAHTFIEDYQGCTLATIAAQAVSALEERRQSAQQRKKSTGKLTATPRVRGS